MLPAVAWIVPNGKVSEHPPALIRVGQAYVTGLVNAIIQAPTWNSTAIFSRGTTGAASTTTSSRPRSTRTRTGFAYPGS